MLQRNTVQRQSCGCSFTSNNNRDDFCSGSGLNKINHCSVYDYNSKCFRSNQANLVRKVISRDLDVSFTFRVKQCVRCPGIFLGDTNCCSMHYWEKYNVLCRQCVVLGCCQQPVAGLFAGGLGVGHVWLSSADRTESGSGMQGAGESFQTGRVSCIVLFG